jgi:hypothetical protein
MDRGRAGGGGSCAAGGVTRRSSRTALRFRRWFARGSVKVPTLSQRARQGWGTRLRGFARSRLSRLAWGWAGLIRGDAAQNYCLRRDSDRRILSRKRGAPMHRIALLITVALLSVSAGHSGAISTHILQLTTKTVRRNTFVSSTTHTKSTRDITARPISPAPSSGSTEIWAATFRRVRWTGLR